MIWSRPSLAIVLTGALLPAGTVVDCTSAPGASALATSQRPRTGVRALPICVFEPHCKLLTFHHDHCPDLVHRIPAVPLPPVLASRSTTRPCTRKVVEYLRGGALEHLSIAEDGEGGEMEEAEGEDEEDDDEEEEDDEEEYDDDEEYDEEEDEEEDEEGETDAVAGATQVGAPSPAHGNIKVRGGTGSDDGDETRGANSKAINKSKYATQKEMLLSMPLPPVNTDH